MADKATPTNTPAPKMSPTNSQPCIVKTKVKKITLKIKFLSFFMLKIFPNRKSNTVPLIYNLNDNEDYTEID